MLAEASQRLGGTRARRRSSASAPRIWYNPELRSTLFLVPGSDRVHRDDHRRRLDGAVDRAREGERHDGADPDGADLDARRSSLGKTLPYLVLSQISAFIVILAAMALFGLPMRGDWVALFVVVALFLIGALGTGLLVSTIAPRRSRSRFRRRC